MGSDVAPGLGQALPHLACIYLDYNATTPVFPEVSSEMLPYLTTHFGNPSSIHTYGRHCKAAVDKARGQVAQLLNCEPEEVVFTACGTESDHHAIYGTVMAARQEWAQQAAEQGAVTSAARVPHVVASVIEHPAVLQYLSHLQGQGICSYALVPVNREGVVSAADVAAAVTPDTVLVTIMHSNNEVGSLQPISEISAAIKSMSGGQEGSQRIRVHTDAAQSVGKVPVDVQALGVDMATIVGHKFGAPKGVAALYIRQGTQVVSFLHGGGQERGRRAGTENVMLLVGLGRACQLAHEEGPATWAHMRSLRDRLQSRLMQALPPGVARVNGPPEQRLPNTLSISIRGLSASAALSQLADKLAASAGAACHSGGKGTALSSVLKAMQVDEEYGRGTLRLSVGRHSTAEEVDAAVDLIVEEARQQGVFDGV